RHGGTVEKFIGDAVMAVFGVPQVHEDDALRAVRAALDMQSALARLNDELEREWNTRIQARIGVNTGEVVAADPSSGESFVSGDAVNVAARLEQAAEPGEILLGEPTYRLVRVAVIAEPVAEPLTLKGKAEPVPAFRLVVVEAGAELLPRRFDSPLVGRDRELAAVLDGFDQTVSASTARLVTVIGHAGVGKSRLTHEIATSLQGRSRILRGRCLPYGEGITFWPVAECIQQAAGLDELTSPDEAMAKVAALLPDGEDPVVTERLGAVLGISENAGAIQESFWAIRRCFEALAAERPLMVVFDDIQWGEPTFHDLIQYLATFATGRPVFVLCLARPELLEIRPDWGEVGQVIRLEPLGPDDSERMVANLLGEWSGPEEVGRQIVSSAGGNPLFLEELLRMLVDEGVLARENGAWVARGDVSRMGAPDTVQAVIAARLDRLDPIERDVLQRASVVGEVFWWGAVAELSGRAESAAVGRSLQALVRRELIRPDPSTFAGEDSFRFGHLLIRDVAYESLPKKVRAELHARFASWLEARAGDRAAEYEEIVGYHAERAYRYLAELGPVDERGAALAELAAARLRSAGLRAFARGDNPSAANLLSRSIDLLPMNDRRALDVLLPLGVALSDLGRFEEADAAYERAVEGGKAIGDRRLELRAATRAKFTRMLRSAEASHAEALDAIEQSVGEFEELGDDAGLGEALRFAGIVHMWAGRAAHAVRLWERGIQHARRAGDVRLESDLGHWIGLAVTQGSTPVDEALGRVQALVESLPDDPMLRCQMSRFQGELEAMRGRLPQARAFIGEGTDMARQLGLVMDIGGGFLRSTGFIAQLAGDLAAAEVALREGMETLERIGDIGHQVSVAADLAMVILQTPGREEEALALADRHEPLMIEDDVDAMARWEAIRARVLARLGDPVEAERLARQSVERSWATDYTDLRGISQEALAEVLERSGRTKEAADAMRQAIQAYEAKGSVAQAAAARKALVGVEAGTPTGPG
ncbi:MAG TPA: AAA family ATPase, partial [Actinomycetota bacterium]|nr:AAA family ATPase [Actinomycetota bacterium]